jgi:O-antigen/teichoic acid export membrane protein
VVDNLKEYKFFVQRIGLTGISRILVSLSSLILLIILTKNISITDYGIYVQVLVTMTLLPIFGTLGLVATMNRFLASKKIVDEIQEGFYSIFFVIVVMSFFVSIILFILSYNIAHVLFNNNIIVAQLMPLLIIFATLNVVIEHFFRTFQQFKKLSIFLIFQAYLLVLFVAYFAIKDSNIIYVIVGSLIAQIITFIIGFVVIIKNIGFKIPKFLNLKEYLSFGIPNMPTLLSNWMVDSSDRYLISFFLGSIFVGYYSPGYTLGWTFIGLLAAPFIIILPSLLPYHYDQGQEDKVKIFLKYSLKYFLIFAIPAFFGLSILSKQFLYILTTPEIASNGYLVTPFTALSAVFFGCYIIFFNVLFLQKATKTLGSIWILSAIINLILNIILIPLFGFLAAAAATLFVYGLSLVLTIIYSNKFIKFDFEWSSMIKSLFSSIIMSVIIIIFYPNGIFNLISLIGVSLIVYLALFYVLGGFKKEEIKFFRDLLNSYV